MYYWKAMTRNPSLVALSFACWAFTAGLSANVVINLHNPAADTFTKWFLVLALGWMACMSLFCTAVTIHAVRMERQALLHEKEFKIES